MPNKRLLILNLLHEANYRASFDNRMAEIFRTMDILRDTIHLEDLGNGACLESHTHLLISGSTESATEDNDWYADLDSVIHHFLSNGKSILGICFGHQFLVRHLLGRSHVRQSASPEMGWTDITLSGNPLFHDLTSLKSAVFHYDEVFDLDDRFEITAHSARCAVQGFQVKGRPVWGIQFHPDFMYRDVPLFVEEIREKDGRFEQMHCRTAVTRDEFRHNDLIFRNWLDVSQPFPDAPKQLKQP